MVNENGLINNQNLNGNYYSTDGNPIGFTAESEGTVTLYRCIANRDIRQGEIIYASDLREISNEENNTVPFPDLFPDGEVFIVELSGPMQAGECVYESVDFADIDIGVVLENAIIDNDRYRAPVRLDQGSELYKYLTKNKIRNANKESELYKYIRENNKKDNSSKEVIYEMTGAIDIEL